MLTLVGLLSVIMVNKYSNVDNGGLCFLNTVNKKKKKKADPLAVFHGPQAEKCLNI